ncbi:MAG TPA: hypothetical protein DDX06_01080 [Curvibacter sp.]|nr:hypothetical protein [Curvibacter sp.]
MTAIVLAVAAFFAGQQLAPVEVRNVPVPVHVPVPVECREPVPDRPAMPTDLFAAKPTVDQLAVARAAEIEIREGYEIQLRGALERCTAPIKSE